MERYQGRNMAHVFILSCQFGDIARKTCSHQCFGDIVLSIIIRAIFVSLPLARVPKATTDKPSMQIDQSHRYGHPQAACSEPAGSYDKTTRTAICFEYKTQYLLIRAERAPYTRIVVFWHISNIPPMISQSSCNTSKFYIAAIFVKYCCTTGSWLL